MSFLISEANGYGKKKQVTNLFLTGYIERTFEVSLVSLVWGLRLVSFPILES
jgi:hypothetical protein